MTITLVDPVRYALQSISKKYPDLFSVASFCICALAQHAVSIEKLSPYLPNSNISWICKFTSANKMNIKLGILTVSENSQIYCTLNDSGGKHTYTWVYLPMDIKTLISYMSYLIEIWIKD